MTLPMTMDDACIWGLSICNLSASHLILQRGLCMVGWLIIYRMISHRETLFKSLKKTPMNVTRTILTIDRGSSSMEPEMKEPSSPEKSAALKLVIGFWMTFVFPLSSLNTRPCQPQQFVLHLYICGASSSALLIVALVTV
jgi:hypothetical protein